MKIGISISATIVVLGAIAMFIMAGWTHPPIDTVQRGYRGLGMVENYDPRALAVQAAQNTVPEPPWPLEPSEGPPAGEVYENLKVLGDIPVDHFDRLMAAITEWVSPEQGCGYCHNEENLADDSKYTKVVARRMLEMTQHINNDWDGHVGTVGVTCYTCHRGQPVPAYVAFNEADQPQGLVGNRAGQNAPSARVGMTSLPHPPLAQFLSDHQDDIRVISTTALPAGSRKSIKQTEGTYGLMVQMSNALGVNCTYCHNSRSFFAWDQSTPQRTTAWHGIRLVNDVNQAYLDPLRPEFPPHRLGPLGDVPKVECATCHQGVYKPLFGADMRKDYPSLGGEGEQGAAATQ